MTDTFVDAIAAKVIEQLKPLLAQPVRPRLLTVEQAATYLGRTVQAIRKLKARAIIPAVQADGRVMFDVQDLDAWVTQNKV